MKYRKKPVVINATQFLHIHAPNGVSYPEFTDSNETEIYMTIVKAWSKGRNALGGLWIDGENLKITTLEGVMEAKPGDYIIEGINGELYPCKPDIFAKTYEQVNA